MDRSEGVERSEWECECECHEYGGVLASIYLGFCFLVFFLHLIDQSTCTIHRNIPRELRRNAYKSENAELNASSSSDFGFAIRTNPIISAIPRRSAIFTATLPMSTPFLCAPLDIAHFVLSLMLLIRITVIHSPMMVATQTMICGTTSDTINEFRDSIQHICRSCLPYSIDPSDWSNDTVAITIAVG